MSQVLEATKQTFIVHLDATGSLIHGQGHTYLYSLVASIKLDKIKAFPLLEFISQKHDKFTITEALGDWEIRTRAQLPRPEIIVTDFSWALLHAVSESFQKKPLKEAINNQFLSMHQNKGGYTIMRLCSNHLMHAICRKLKPECLSQKVLTLLYHYNC